MRSFGVWPLLAALTVLVAYLFAYRADRVLLVPIGLVVMAAGDLWLPYPDSWITTLLGVVLIIIGPVKRKREMK
jgi:hypothetical protein